jgi:hypothetical protein
MNVFAWFLLGSTAIIGGIAGVQGADLPTRKAAPVDYVRICTVFGAGYFYIPGGDTCIKIGGQARFAYVWQQQYSKGDTSNYRTEGGFRVDSMTQTEWGTLHTAFSIDFRRNTGSTWFASTTDLRGGAAIQFQGPAGGFPGFAGVDTLGELQTGVYIGSAYVQWGGLTAGRLQSFFDFYADNDTWFAIADSDVITNALAYTYTFGNGFSATLSIEDPKERQRYPVAGLAPLAAGGINPAGPPFGSFTNVFPFALSPFAAPAIFGGAPFPVAAGSLPGTISYTQRESIPDVVGVLRVEQSWGTAQLSGAYHRVSTVGATVLNLTPTNAGGAVVNPLVPTVPGGFGAETGNGWAVQGGVKINLPMLAAGDYLYLQAAYSKGEISYVNSGYVGAFSASGYPITFDNLLAYDAVVGPTGRMRLTPAWSAMASLEHYWTPTIRQAVFGSVAHISYDSAIRTAAGFAAGAACPTCFGTAVLVLPAGATNYNPFSTLYDGGTSYYLGSNLIWSPVSNLDIGVEISYARDDFQHKQWDLNRGNGLLLKDVDLWLAQFRATRSF